MHLQTIVAFTDYSASAEHALDRAALVAASHGARLRIVYSTHTPDPRFVDPYARLEQRARQLARRHGVTVVAQDLGSGDVVEDALAAAAGADLLVLDRRMPQGWRALLRGSVLRRILRSSPCPVLVVQRAPQGSYQRKLVAVVARQVDRDQPRVRRRQALHDRPAVVRRLGLVGRGIRTPDPGKQPQRCRLPLEADARTGAAADGRTAPSRPASRWLRPDP